MLYRKLREFKTQETMFALIESATWVKRHASFLPYRNLREIKTHETMFVQTQSAT